MRHTILTLSALLLIGGTAAAKPSQLAPDPALRALPFHILTAADFVQMEEQLDNGVKSGFPDLEPMILSSKNFTLLAAVTELMRTGLTVEEAIRRVNAHELCIEYRPEAELCYLFGGPAGYRLGLDQHYSSLLSEERCLNYELWKALGYGKQEFVSYMDAFIVKVIVEIKMLQRMSCCDKRIRWHERQWVLIEMNEKEHALDSYWRGGVDSKVEIKEVFGENADLGIPLVMTEPEALETNRLLYAVLFVPVIEETAEVETGGGRVKVSRRGSPASACLAAGLPRRSFANRGAANAAPTPAAAANLA